MYLGRAIEEILLYVEGRPGVLRTWVLAYLAAQRGGADQALCRAQAAGLIESHPAPEGVRLWITRTGLSLLHSVDYSAAVLPAEAGAS